MAQPRDPADRIERLIDRNHDLLSAAELARAATWQAVATATESKLLTQEQREAYPSTAFR